MQGRFARIHKYIFGPNVKRVHKSTDGHHRCYDYEPNALEEASERILGIANTTRLIVSYTLPIWGLLIYRKGYYTVAHALGFVKFAGWASFFIFGALVVRGFGRSRNQDYVTFLDVLHRACNQRTNDKIRDDLRRYDFDFRHWPIDFSWNESSERASHSSPSLWKRILSQLSVILGGPKGLAAYTVAHTFGIRLVYPGCVQLLNAACASTLSLGRYKLVEEHGGIRAKLETEDGNEIDTMFIDRRQKGNVAMFECDAPTVPSTHGNVLVVCCEGNAGFYEGGCMLTPIQCGFSVLGWNHPGFMCSTGKPFPDADSKAIDVVMQYATSKLGFQPEEIMIFAWSIGAFTAINAAVNYPNIRGLLLDSTFYDIMPFAKKMMPAFADNFVAYTVRNHLNLHNSENLAKYEGPVSFIRRMNDEVMNLASPHDISSNMGNRLLESFLRSRYPGLFDDPNSNEEKPGFDSQSVALWDWLSAPDQSGRDQIMSKWNADSDESMALFKAYEMDNQIQERGERVAGLTSEKKIQVVLFLADKHMSHLVAAHCSPLPPSLFTLPWCPDLIDN